MMHRNSKELKFQHFQNISMKTLKSCSKILLGCFCNIRNGVVWVSFISLSLINPRFASLCFDWSITLLVVLFLLYGFLTPWFLYCWNDNCTLTNWSQTLNWCTNSICSLFSLLKIMYVLKNSWYYENRQGEARTRFRSLKTICIIHSHTRCRKLLDTTVQHISLL